MNSKLIVLVAVTLGLTACKGGGKGSSSKPSDSKPTEPTDPSADPSDQKDTSPNTPIVSTTTAGTVKVDLSGAAAVGIAIVSSDSALPVASSNGSGTLTTTAGQVVLALTDTPEKLLTKVTTDGKVIGLELPDMGGTVYEIKAVTAVGEYGLIVHMDAPGYFPGKSAVTMIWIKPDGTVLPFAPDNYSDGNGDFFKALDQKFVGNKLWIHNVNQNALWSYDFEDGVFEKFTDEMQAVMGFILPSDGTPYVQISLSNELNSDTSIVLRRVKSNGGIDEFKTAFGGYQIDNSMDFLDKAIIYGQTVSINDAGDLEMSVLPAPLASKRSGYTDKAVIVGQTWVASQLSETPYAFNVGANMVAGNPFTRSPPEDALTGTVPLVRATNVDTPKGIHFDGANLVRVSRSGSGVTTSLYRKLLYPKGRTFRVNRVFGEDHGFDGDDYGAFATSKDNKFWWVTIDKDTGFVDANGSFEINVPTGISTSENIDEFSQYRTVYKVGAKFVVIAQGASANSISWLEVDDQNSEKFEFNEKINHANLGLYSSTFVDGVTLMPMNHAFAAVNSSTLYIPYDGGVKTYVVASPTTLGFVSSTSFFAGNNVGTEDCNTSRHVAAIVRTPSPLVPGLVFRGCKSAGEDSLYFATTNWAFTGAATSSIDLATTIAQSNTQRRFPEPIYAANDSSTTDLIFIKRWTSLIHDYPGSASTTVANVITTGLFPFGAPLINGEGIDVAAASSGDSFIISGKNSLSNYVSYRVNLGARTETIIPDLNGVQVYTASLIGSTFLVNGLRLTDNVRVTLSFAMDGTKLGVDEKSNIQIVQLVPFGN